MTEQLLQSNLYLKNPPKQKKKTPSSATVQVRRCTQPCNQAELSMCKKHVKTTSKKKFYQDSRLTTLVRWGGAVGGRGCRGAGLCVWGAEVSVLEASLGLDVIEDLLQLLVLEATLQTENTENFIDTATEQPHRHTHRCRHGNTASSQITDTTCCQFCSEVSAELNQDQLWTGN